MQSAYALLPALLIVFDGATAVTDFCWWRDTVDDRDLGDRPDTGGEPGEGGSNTCTSDEEFVEHGFLFRVRRGGRYGSVHAGIDESGNQMLMDDMILLHCHTHTHTHARSPWLSSFGGTILY